MKSTVTCLLAVDLADLNGKLTSYVLAADSSNNLHVIHQGQIISCIKTPSVVTAVSVFLLCISSCLLMFINLFFS